MHKNGVVLFYSVNGAFRLEKELVKSNLKVKLIPTPRHLSSDCGTALRFEWKDRDKVKDMIERLCMEIEGVHGI